MAIQNFSWVVPDKLAGCALPGKALLPGEDYVFPDLKYLYNNGIRCLLSLTDRADSFGRLCEKAGMDWIYFPIPDFGIPSDMALYERVINTSVRYLKADSPVCVHCYAGVGRTGMVLACIVGIYFSISTDDAIDKVRSCRSVLDTDEQRGFVINFLDGKKKK